MLSGGHLGGVARTVGICVFEGGGGEKGVGRCRAWVCGVGVGSMLGVRVWGGGGGLGLGVGEGVGDGCIE